MDAFTISELSTLRMPMQAFIPKLAVFKPTKLFTGLVADSPSKGDMTINVTAVSGSLDNVLPGMELVANPGINEVRLRIRSVSGSQIGVEENKHSWNNGELIECLFLFAPHPIKSRIVQNGDTVTYYEDYDISYSDQNEVFEPVVNMGVAAYALEKDSQVSGTYSELELDASDSFAYDSAITSYQWGILYGAQDILDAEIIGSDTAATCQFRFWQTGDYYVYCTVTAANGKSSTGYRPIMVRNSHSGYADSPFFNFNANASGSRDTGYWSADITIFEDCNEDDFPRNVPVVLYGSAVYYDGTTRTTQQVGWHYDNAAHQRFVGWVTEESWTHDYIGKGVPVSLNLVGILGLMDNRSNYSGWLQYSENPGEWTDMKGLSSDRMTYFYLRNRSTLLNITDWHPANTVRLAHYSEIGEGTEFSSIKDYLFGAEIIEMCSDRNGAIWSEFDGNHLNDTDRASVVTNLMTITDDDHMNEIHIPTTRDAPEISWLSIDGLYFDGVNDVPRIAWSGYVMQSEGNGQTEQSGLIIGSQTDLNELCGRMFAVSNNPFKSIEMTSHGFPYDIAPQASVNYSLPSGTFREEEIDELDILIRDVSDKFTVGGGLLSELKLEAIIRDTGADVGPNVPICENGVEGIFPPEITGPDPGDFSVNWNSSLFDWPSYEDTIPDTLPTAIALANSPAIYAWTSTKLGRLRKGTVNWELVLSASDLYPGASDPRIRMFRLHPWDPKNKAIVLMSDGLVGFDPAIVQINNLDSASPSYETILSTAQIKTLTGGTTPSLSLSEPIQEMDLSINVNGFISVTLIGSNRGQVIYRKSDSDSWHLSLIDNMADGGCTLVMGHHAPSSSSGRMYAISTQIPGGTFETAVYVSTDNGANWSLEYNFHHIRPGYANAPLDMPYEGNLSDLMLYASIGLAGYSNSIVRRNSDNTYTEISPSDIDGYWGARYILSYTYDPAQVVIRGMSPTLVDADDRLMLSVDSGATWTTIDNPTASGMPTFIGGWPNDKEVLFIIAPDAPNDILLVSSNFVSGSPSGIVWEDLTHDFYTTVDTINDAIGLVPVWVE